MLSQGLGQVLSFKRLPIKSEGSYLSVFKKTEEKLFSCTEYQEALFELTEHLDTSMYTCVMDFMFVELFPMWKESCLNYYNGIGPSMFRDQRLTKEMIESYDLVMSEILLEAILSYGTGEDKDEYSWDHILDLADVTGGRELFRLQELREAN